MDESGGQVVANFGRQLLVEDSKANRHPCRPKGRRIRAVCGDRVLWHRGDGQIGVVTKILPREHVLSRPDARVRVTPDHRVYWTLEDTNAVLAESFELLVPLG